MCGMFYYLIAPKLYLRPWRWNIGIFISQTENNNVKPIIILAVRQCVAWYNINRMTFNVIPFESSRKKKPTETERAVCPKCSSFLYLLPAWALSTPFAVLAPPFSLRTNNTRYVICKSWARKYCNSGDDLKKKKERKTANNRRSARYIPGINSQCYARNVIR